MNTQDCPHPLRRRLKHRMRSLNIARSKWLKADRTTSGRVFRAVNRRAAACLQLLVVYGDIEAQRRRVARELDREASDYLAAHHPELLDDLGGEGGDA